MSLVSVIVPVYQAEQYLEDCLNSILASTYRNLEVILVDDGSLDRSGEICDAYAARDPRVRVIHQENRGVVAARNTGLQAAAGDYLTFTDSDDMVSPVMYERMVAVMEQTGADITACEYDTDSSNLLTEPSCAPAATACFDTYDEQMAVLFCAPSIRSVTWTGVALWDKLYRRSRITFPVRDGFVIGEDLMFNWEYIAASHSMAILAEKLYYYRQDPNSTMGSYNNGVASEASARKGAAVIALWDRLVRDTSVSDPELLSYIQGRAAYMAHGGLWRIYGAGLNHSCAETVRIARQLIRDHAGKVLRDSETYNMKIKAVMLLCRSCFPLWVRAAQLAGAKS